MRIGLNQAVNATDAWKLAHLRLEAHTALGDIVLFDADVNQLVPPGGELADLPSLRPDAIEMARLASSLISAEDKVRADALLWHLQANETYYRAALLRDQDPAERLEEFRHFELLPNLNLADAIENELLDANGVEAAFPLTFWGQLMIEQYLHIGADPDRDSGYKSVVEDLVSLPTGGVFAEAKLGHCNASEIIDNFRFWDWQQSPIPVQASDIGTLDTGSRREAPAGMGSTAFPAALVNIVNPTAAPDPVGLSAAMRVATQPDIFRDMSGMKELAPLLQKLSDNATTMGRLSADAKNKKDLIEVIRQSGMPPDKQAKLIESVITGAATETDQRSAPQPTTTTQAPAGTAARSSTQAPPAGTGANPAPTAASPPLDQPPSMPEPKAPPPLLTPTPKRAAPPDPKLGAATGLGFMIIFNRAVYGTPGDGAARVTVASFGARDPEKDAKTPAYVPGAPGTTTVPTAAQVSTEPETFSRRIDAAGTITLQTRHSTAPGTIHIQAIYVADTSQVVQVLSNSIYERDKSIMRFSGAKPFTQPKSGSVVIVEVTPHVLTKKVVSKTSETVLNELGTGAEGNYVLIKATATGKHGTTTSGEQGEEYVISYLTGAFDWKIDGVAVT